MFIDPDQSIPLPPGTAPLKRQYISVNLHMEGGKKIPREPIPCTKYTRSDIPLYSHLGLNKNSNRCFYPVIYHLLCGGY